MKLKSLNEIRGLTEVYVKRPGFPLKPVCIKPNTINQGILDYLSSRLQNNFELDYALDNLFTVDNQQKGGSQDNKDGIVVRNSAGNYLSTVTTSVTPSQTGKKWRGQIEFNSSMSITSAFLGWNFGGGAGVHFVQQYATQSFTSESVDSGDIMIINWEIYIGSLILE